MHRALRALAALLLATLGCGEIGAVGYDIVYVRQPRFGDGTNTTWPEVFHPARIDPGADLMLLHPDGSEEVLVAGGNGSVTDPVLSFDAQWVYYAYFPDMRPQAINSQRNLPYAGADIYRIHLRSRQIERLTQGGFSPNTGAGNWDESNPLDPPSGLNRLGYGILNLGPMPLPGGRIAFTSNRNALVPPKGFTHPTLQMYVMDEDGGNVTAIAPMSISSALHPTVLRDGRLMFSTHESQGLRDRRLWGIWTIWPDGRNWAPLISAFNEPQSFHFMTQLGDGDIVVVDYYNLNNNGFGALYRLPPSAPAGQPAFYDAFGNDAPGIAYTSGGGHSLAFTMPFQPRGMRSITPFTHGGDEAAPVGAGGVRVGKFTHPSAAPGNDLLVVWTPGPANDLTRPTTTPYYDAGLYLIPDGETVNDPAELVLIKNDPAWNEAWPRAVVPYSAVHGVREPDDLPWLPNDGSLHAALPAGTPHGLVGSSSFYKRESFPGIVRSWANSFDGLDAFNTSENGQSNNWFSQGSDAGRYDNADIWAVRVVAMEPNTHRSYGPNEGRQFHSHANERLRILGEIPLRKTAAGGGPLLDAENNPDTSFLARIPADTPFTFQTLDRRGMVLNMAQTWHQVRPGEMRVDCGGCHAHSQQPLAFEGTAASAPDYPVADLSVQTPLLAWQDDAPTLRVEPVSHVDVEFLADIRPILQARCVSCHRSPNPAGNLDLDDLTEVDGLPGDYYRLAADKSARFGHKPVIRNGTWRQTNASRYVRSFQSRRSLLIWKLFGERLDGWSNEDHPTESVPGDANTLPAGADPNDADLDFTGSIMPPPPAQPLSEDEKRLFVRWIDLGAPIDTGNPDYGWHLDDLRPTLTVASPRPRTNSVHVTELRVGVADAHSGIEPGSLSVRLDAPVAGRAAGAELADLFVEVAQDVWALSLPAALPRLERATLQAGVRDRQGNITRVAVSFSTVMGPDDLLRDGFE
ncbi:hypothetical protein [Pseudomarimonas salicorniae]|uniref:Hydrazine synthase alpha subunit middle domain-containing protein n=1 Tax=Pseudomarimonas salicorniae TaxID=2933270 RepID=A0ABT0GG64_9GAMM|nr:hypothetical protein [Lysobacter sp. CAU 1642]MCK7593530.1 hypothetical protein [Lysobacter sp. CAU 1642]